MVTEKSLQDDGVNVAVNDDALSVEFAALVGDLWTRYLQK